MGIPTSEMLSRSRRAIAREFPGRRSVRVLVAQCESRKALDQTREALIQQDRGGICRDRMDFRLIGEVIETVLGKARRGKMNPIGEFGAMLIAALIIAGAFLVGRGIGLGIRSWIQFFRDRRVEDRAAAVPQPPPPQVIRPVGPGLLWQNSRDYAPILIHGRMAQQRTFRQTGPLPEVKTVRSGAGQHSPTESDDGSGVGFPNGEDSNQW